MTGRSRGAGDLPNNKAGSIGRVLVLVVVTGIAWFSGANAVANITARWNPALALQLAPDHPIALAARAESLVRQSRSDEAELSAKAAVANSSLAVSALATLAQLQGNSDPEKAGRVFSYVFQLSRRETPAHLWLVQEAASRGDTRKMLMHMDAAMRVSKESRDFLYPVMAALIANERALEPAIATFAASPSWLEGFFGYVIYNNGPLVNLTRITMALPAESIPRGTSVRASLLRRLTETGYYSEAQALYREIAPAKANAIIRDPAFTDGGPYRPFDWTYTEGTELRAVPVGGRSEGLQLYARTGRGGRAARQMMFLSPGIYALASEAEDLPSDQAGQAIWMVRCVGGAGELVRLAMSGDVGETRHSASFSVPSTDCQAQWLELHVRAGFEPDGFAGVIRNVSVEPTPRLRRGRD